MSSCDWSTEKDIIVEICNINNKVQANEIRDDLMLQVPMHKQFVGESNESRVDQ